MQQRPQQRNHLLTVIEVSKPIALSSTVTVSGKKISICAVGDISIARETDSFTGDMFKVSGENSSLSFEAKDGGSLTVSGAFTDAAVTADGSIVNVSDSGSFGLFSNVVLSGNISSADGAAVNCTGGQIALAGGTITGNTGAKGAVYSDSAIRVQGTVTVKDNKIGDAQANVYLDGTAGLLSQMNLPVLIFLSPMPARQRGQRYLPWQRM